MSLQGDRSILENALLGALLPAAVSALVLAAARPPWRARAPDAGPVRPWSEPLALGLAFPAGYVAINGWPPFLARPLAILPWMFYLALLGGALGVHQAVSRRGIRLARVVVAVAMPVLLLGFVRAHQWSGREGVLWTCALALFVLLSWSGLVASEARLARAPLFLGWMLVEALAAGAYQLSHSSVLAQLAGALAAGLFPCALLAFWRPVGAGTPALATPFTLLHIGLLWAAHFASDLTRASFVLLSLAPLVATCAALVPARPRVRAALTVALPVLLALVALLVESRAASSDPY